MAVFHGNTDKRQCRLYSRTVFTFVSRKVCFLEVGELGTETNGTLRDRAVLPDGSSHRVNVQQLALYISGGTSERSAQPPLMCPSCSSGVQTHFRK
jgi:hypothetical protein